MSKKKYPTELEHSEWLKRQNYFLEEQNKSLKKKLLESEEYINSVSYTHLTLPTSDLV